MTFVLGLTGSIGMGKSATAALFRRFGVAVHDADMVVHTLYRGAAAPLIEAAFPGTVANGAVDREAMSRVVLNAPERLRQLESIVHPLVRTERDRFLCEASASRAQVAVLDIPLLFETGGETRQSSRSNRRSELPKRHRPADRAFVGAASPDVRPDQTRRRASPRRAAPASAA